jgi:hypothetical protein
MQTQLADEFRTAKSASKPAGRRALSLLVEKIAHHAQEPRGAIGLRHIIIASGPARLLLVALHGAGIHRDDKLLWLTEQAPI